MPNNLPPSYPFDPTGVSAANLISNERQILIKSNGVDFHFLVPVNGPFFETSLVVSITDPVTNINKILTVGIDYYPTHWFISASRACASGIYGSITFLDLTLNGIVNLTYQTIGGNWTIDSSTIATILANVTSNPRTTSWEEVTNYPIVFPPTPHQWNLVDMVGASDIVNSINNIQAALTNNLGNKTGIMSNDVYLEASTGITTIPITQLSGVIYTTDSVLIAIKKLNGNILNLTNSLNALITKVG